VPKNLRKIKGGSAQKARGISVWRETQQRSDTAASVVSSIGSTIEEAWFSGLLTRVEIGQTRMSLGRKGL
jgi:hypothetical protein